MKIAINLNDRGYLHDYVDMGVSLIMAGSDYSCRKDKGQDDNSRLRYKQLPASECGTYI